MLNGEITMSWEAILKSKKGESRIQGQEIKINQYREVIKIIDNIVKDAENAKIYLRDINRFPRAKVQIKIYLEQIKRLYDKGELDEVKIKAEELKNFLDNKWIPDMEAALENMKRRRIWLDSPEGKNTKLFDKRMERQRRRRLS
jgi:hypothetical protein